ncbi:hypothetical protein EVAR_97506_1 [Eumeta japonica]|uniref:Uncharacterized protein n=1 Tax=Eumeta variegata TaxID=151549 RepID=A0A4C1WKQ7_EUMVA|nr:hypothetical protein EVAR_97506_1 [Eumeta japonica]
MLCYRLPFPIHVEVLYDMDIEHLPILITLGATAYLTFACSQTHHTNWSAYQSTLKELHIGKFFSCSATTHLPTPNSRRWDLPPRLQRALQHKRNLQRMWAI